MRLKSKDVLFVIIPLTVLGFLIGVSLTESKAFGISESIAFSSPTTNQYVLDSDVSFVGTYQSAYTPTIQIKVDSYPWIAVTPNGNSWATTLDGLTDGAHSAEIWMQDPSGNYTDSVNFQTTTSYVTPTKYNGIMVLPTEGCQKMIAYHANIGNVCPTIAELAPFDTTHGIGAGVFIKDKNGTIVSRSKPQLNNYWNFWTNSKDKTVCIFCQFDYFRENTIPIIFVGGSDSIVYSTPVSILNDTVQYSIFNGTAYNTRTTTDTTPTETLSINFKRFVSADCMSALIPNDKVLLADTIYYINSGCTKTNFNFTKTIVQVQPRIDIAHSRQFIYQQWQTKELAINKGNCITHKCAPTKDPNSNW